MNRLTKLEQKYAGGGRVSTPHALAAVKRAIAHVERGDHKAAHAELMKSPDALNHPQVQAAMSILAPQHFDEGGEVRGSSSPGSPGVSGAIKDAVRAARDYFIDRPRRELQAARRENEDSYEEGDYQGPARHTLADGYAAGGKVTQVKNMAKFMIEKLGIPDADAHRLAREYHVTQDPVSSTARKMADELATRHVLGAGAKMNPAQLAQALAAGHVDPKELQHLLYTDPTLTPLINRYQSGIDNQNLSQGQKQALIAKLQSMGGTTPPQVPQASALQMAPPAAPPMAPPPGGPPLQQPPSGAGGSGMLSNQNADALLQGPPQ